MTDLAPLSRQTAAEACAERLREGILAGRWAPGERLPPERVLAEQLGVTRVTLRGGLAALAAEGLVEARQGSGTRVLDFRRAAGPGLLPALAARAQAEGALPVVVRDLLCLRRGLAGEVLGRLAAEPPSLEALGAYDAAVASFARAAARPEADGGARLRALAEADLAVLRALVGLTGSAVFHLALNPVAEALGSIAELRAAVYREPEANLAGWRALGTWLRAPEAAAVPGFLALLSERDAATLAHLGAAP